MKIQTDQAQRNEYKIDEPLPISIFHTKSDRKQSTTVNNDDFICFQLLISCLIRIKSNAKDKNELFSICQEEYQGNETELDVVREFQENYASDRAIWWFTRESFVCRLLNKAFQVLNADLLYYFHFFIRDIQQQLKENKFSSPIRTYRAQLMPYKEYQLIKFSIGELISINTFLPTIPNRERALEIIQNVDEPSDFRRVLFEIEADPRLHDVKPFSNISSLNYFYGIDIIFFMPGTIFHTTDIQKEGGVVIIKMETCSDSDQKVKSTIDNMKTECFHKEGNLLSLGYILIRMKKFDLAEKCLTRYMDETSDDLQSMARCCQGLGSIAMKNQDYESSVNWYNKALRINQSIYGFDDPETASDYNTIGYVYTKKGSYYDAIESYTEALHILIRTLGKDHPKVGVCYKHMGYAYEMDRKYSEAIDYYQKALLIRQRTLFTDHPDVAKLYIHMGSAYTSAGQFNQAIKHYKLALDIYTKINCNKHPDIIMTMKKIGLTHEAAGQLNQSRQQLEKVASLLHQIYRPNHPEVIQIELDIHRISAKLK